jgi:hypothetical protein
VIAIEHWELGIANRLAPIREASRVGKGIAQSNAAGHLLQIELLGMHVATLIYDLGDERHGHAVNSHP